MKHRLVLFTLLLALAVFAAACGGADTAAPALEEIDLSTLAGNVDVQTVAAVKDNPGVFLLDVREPDEYAAGHIPGITLLPMGEVPARLSEIPTDKEVIVTCRTGNRSSQVVDYLREQGFTNVHNMEGGIVAWEAAGYEVEQ
jgi:rhodanese-related sulfurtransferase